MCSIKSTLHSKIERRNNVNANVAVKLASYPRFRNILQNYPACNQMGKIDQ